ncbi:putative UDP-Gal or UDP-GlcNAc-dependent glycosyltransferase [Trypanosoma theileri]|uniref:Hexosyltransferase n=1 Tax=Trypanosoma theileri TaxID=67003 RepID=A0A1X0NJS8_9TRYP|nr:putative UDP-Gal or UDP-GlcNAc-dependent glycosyltransferase [Trypanosoma theileri]ORC84768.1 putative UDP-Gal or UDP-GlcNAc-dependent glycosyltransferase [Trypanosoma theileri]
MKRIGLSNPGIIFAFAMCFSLFLFIVAIMYTSGVTPFMDFIIKRTVKLHRVHNSTPVPLPENTSSLDESLRYIPHSTIQTWKERDYLIVFGIPSVDIDGRRRRRYLQRTTCWQFPGVARRANNFTGSMLVLYVLARQPFLSYRYSESLLKEVAEYHDVITLSMNEGRVTTNKSIGDSGKWGLEAEVGLSRKVYFWLEMSLRLFPSVKYIAKGDDDMFLRVPQFLTDLRVLPVMNVYWGKFGKIHGFGGERTNGLFAGGPCYTLSRDVAWRIVSYTPIRDLLSVPFQKELESQYISLDILSEDVMVGVVLRKSGYYRHVVFVFEKKCAFHDVHVGYPVEPVRDSSIMVHHLLESEYKLLMDRFGNDTGGVPRRRRYYKDRRIKFLC